LEGGKGRAKNLQGGGQNLHTGAPQKKLATRGLTAEEEKYYRAPKWGKKGGMKRKGGESFGLRVPNGGKKKKKHNEELLTRKPGSIGIVIFRKQEKG